MRPNTPSFRISAGRAALVALSFGFALVASAFAAAPVQFRFTLPASDANPFARDLWAEVVTPSRQTLHLPVFFLGRGQFAVRARATESGEYRLGAVTEQKSGATAPLTLDAKPVGGAKLRISAIATLPQVMNSSGHPAQLRFADGRPYTPVGANVAWAPNGSVPEKYYEQAFNLFQKEKLNWMRMWMAHWGKTNLDWLAENAGASPAPGTLDLGVAERWDRLVAGAEEHGVYVQLVLQHHGQVSSTVNPNWNQNPWNAANRGGFLQTPTEFFTSPKARELTQWKYRYIVARWGYSPAIVAWELFNEVHWVDALKLDHNEAAVAAWHAEMAAALRRMDSYHHLVTTSTEDLYTPIYAAMDYFQPHLYTADVIAGARAFSRSPSELDRPVFYGEMGDDHLPLSPEQKKSGISIVPPMWASLMGRGRIPAQPWLGADLIERNRLGELGAVARFVAATGIDRHANLVCFSAVVDSAARQSFPLEGVQRWQRRAAPEIDVPLDGRHLPEFAAVPQVYVGSRTARAAGYIDHAVFRVDAPRELNVRAVVVGMEERGASIRVSIDGKTAAEKSWAAKASDAPSVTHPVELPFAIPAGKHALVVENPAGPEWFELGRLDLGVEVSVLAAIGQRSDDFVALWLWHRANIYALEETPAVAGTVSIEDVPAGRWQVTWWDTVKGTPAPAATIDHSGGALRLPTPPIKRHAAVVLTKR